MSNCTDQIIRPNKIKCPREAEFSIIRNDIKKLQKPPVIFDDIEATETVGGVEAGTKFLKGTTLESIVKAILSPEAPVVVGYLYFAVTDEIPSVISEDFEQVELPKNVTRDGVVYYYTTFKKQFESFAYPAELGELQHIYENDLTMFDLIDSFEKIIVFHEGQNYYLYYGVDRVKEDNAKYQFLW